MTVKLSKKEVITIKTKEQKIVISEDSGGFVLNYGGSSYFIDQGKLDKMEEKIKVLPLPCPFCGEKASVVSDIFDEDGLVHAVRCRKGHLVDKWSDTKAEAIKDWNNRAKDG